MDVIKVDQPTIVALEKLITGDKVNEHALAPYRKGFDLVSFFNRFSCQDEYGISSSRWFYAQKKLSELNKTPVFAKLIESVIDPRDYFGTEFSVDEAVDYLNQFLEFDGYKLIKQGQRYRLSLGKDIVSFEHAILDNNAPNTGFMREQRDKCESKISSGDYDGAITNARSLLEAVLFEIECKLTESQQKYNGELKKLYKRVSKQLNMEPSRKDISDSLKQILTGIINIVEGIAPLRNKMSDSHARTYKPAEHHAKLAVNSVHTICMFLLESFDYQIKSGHICLACDKSNT